MDIDRARDTAITALDALNNRKDQDPAYWVGYLANALESVIYELRSGA